MGVVGERGESRERRWMMVRIALLTLAALLLAACPEQPHGQRVIMPPPGVPMRIVEATTVARDVLWRDKIEVTAGGAVVCALVYTLDGELVGTMLDPGGSLEVYGYPGPVTCRPVGHGQVTVWVDEH
jgi:hypothetical protein